MAVTAVYGRGEVKPVAKFFGNPKPECECFARASRIEGLVSLGLRC